MTLENDRIIRALLRQPVDRTPIWLMRQAGRYLPEYRELRKRVPDFMTFCQTPELVWEATMQPLARFPLDAAIVFSDILTVPHAMGMYLLIASGEGPIIRNPIRSFSDVEKLKPITVEDDLAYVMETIRLINIELGNKIPLIGFAGSPWTVATYMVEGRGSKTFSTIKTMMYREPDLLHSLLRRLAKTTVDYLNAQIAAGVRAVMLFDTWGGVLSHNEYSDFSLRYMKDIASQLTREHLGERIPVVFFTKNSDPWLEAIAESGCDAISLDSTVDIAKARQRIGERVALQGNLDPYLLFSKPNRIQQAVIDILDGFGPAPGHVFNLGHGIDPATPIENVTLMVEAVHHYGQRSIVDKMDVTHS